MLTATLNDERLALIDDLPNAVIIDEATFAELAGAELRCPNCGGRVHPRRLHRPEGVAFSLDWAIFAHNPGEAERCRLLGGGESPEHDTLKRRIANYAARNGLPWDVEVSHGNGARSDVIIGEGINRTAVEVQLSGLATATLAERHQRYVDAMGGADTAVMWCAQGTRRTWPPDVCRARIEERDVWRVDTPSYINWSTPSPTQQEPVEQFTYRKARGRLRWVMLGEDSRWIDVDAERAAKRTVAPTRSRSRQVALPDRVETCERDDSAEPEAFVVVFDDVPQPLLAAGRDASVCPKCHATYRGEHFLCAGKPWN